MAKCHLARKAEAVLMVALTLQLAASVACGSARHLLLRTNSEARAGTDADFGLQHPGLSAQAYGNQDATRQARSIHASRRAEQKYEDWTNLQDGYEAELRLHRLRKTVAGGVQLLAVPQPSLDAPQHTVVHRPLFVDQEVPKRDAEVEEDDQDAAAGQHTVDPEDTQEEDVKAPLPSDEDIHSSTVQGTVTLSSEVGRRRFARKLLFDDGTGGAQQQQPAVAARGSWLLAPRKLRQLALSSPFGAMGLFSGASDPVQMSSA